MIKYFLVAVLISTGLSGFAQQLTIQITAIPNPVHTQLYVRGFYGSEQYLVDSFAVAKSPTESFTIPHLQSGMYALNLSGGKDTTLLLISDQLPLQVKTTFRQLERGKVVVGNPNDVRAYLLLTEYRDSLKRTMDSIVESSRAIDEFDPKYETKALALRNKLMAANHLFNTQMDLLTRQYPQTYTAKILTRILHVAVPDSIQQEVFDNFISFSHYHFFRDVPMSNSSIIHNPFIEEKITDYLSDYTYRMDYDKLKDNLRYLLDSLSTNTDVREFIRYVQMKYYIKNGPGKVADYLLQVSAENGCDNSEQFQQNDAIKNLLALMPGKPMPPLSIRDFDGLTRNLYGVMTGKKVGVIVFWASTCTHCRESIPLLYQWYETIRDKGVEVYAVSLDLNPDEWYEYAKQFAPDWVNVSELKGWNSASVSTYGVRSTPAFIVTDKEHRIVLKTTSVMEVEQKVAQLSAE